MASLRYRSTRQPQSRTHDRDSCDTSCQMRNGVEELYRIALDGAGLIQTVDDLAGVVEVGLGVVDVLWETDAGEIAVRHTAEDDLCSNLEIESGISDLHELTVQAQLVVLLDVVVVPGELNETAAVVTLVIWAVRLAVRLTLTFAILGDRLHGKCGFVVSSC